MCNVQPPSLAAVLVLGALVRAALLLYGEFQDANYAIKYTDIDYVVFTDAARFRYEGHSPFQRATYRYTPLLAELLTPNIWLHPAFGKLLFCGCDLLVGCLIYSAAKTRSVPERTAVGCAAAWLLNPIVINVSTRGNAEAVLCVLVVGSVALLLARRTYAAAICYGLAVHFKLYPIIYAPALALAIDRHYRGSTAIKGNNTRQPLPW